MCDDKTIKDLKNHIEAGLQTYRNMERVMGGMRARPMLISYINEQLKDENKIAQIYRNNTRHTKGTE